jgi:general secretion pathway protein D
VKPHPSRTSQRTGSLPGALFRRWSAFWTAALLLVAFPAATLAQTETPLPSNQSAQTHSAAAPAHAAKPGRKTTNSDRRRAVKLYFDASRLFEKEHFEEAMQGYRQAAALDPSNPDYALAAGVARSHAATALVQTAAKDRMRGDAVASRAALERALVLDPGNPQAAGHLDELGDDVLLRQTSPIYEEGASGLASAPELQHTAGPQSFHLRADQRQIVKQVFKAFGVEATLDESIQGKQIRLDVDDASFEETMQALTLLTNSFYVPLDEHRVLVASDTTENRQKFTRLEMETVYLPGLSSEELTQVGTLAKNLFDAQRTVAEPASGSITIRAPENALRVFNNTLRGLLDGHSQVMLDVRMIQISHTRTLNTGVQPPQTMTAFNVDAEEQSIFSANASTVQQIISSGLASANDPLAILAILIAAGDVSGSLFSNGIATFGGGITESALSPGSVTVNLSLNSSDSRELDNLQLRLGDGEEGTVRLGERYPIQTSSYSNLSSSTSSIAGLTTAGTSSALSSLLSSLSSSTSTIPQVEYQDLGLTLKARPNVMRNGDVALTLDLKVDALAGSSINGVPVLNNRAYSTVVHLRQDEGVVVLSQLDKQESLAISGTPGMSEIPGLNSLTGKDNQSNYATLLIVISPHIVREIHAAGHSSMMRIERGQQEH